MALIKHANASMIARDAVVLDLGDLHRQGVAIVQNAQAQAAKIIAEAKAERERIIAGGMDKGFAEGRARGVEEGRKQGYSDALGTAIQKHGEALSKLEANWATELSEYGARRDVLFQRSTDDVIRLAVLIAERVVKRKLEIDPGLVVEQVRSVLGMVSRPTGLVVSIHPEDKGLVQNALPGLLAVFAAVQHVELVEDAALERGSCVARTRAESGGGGEIDASIRTQLERIVELILPTHVVGEAGASDKDGGLIDGESKAAGDSSW